MKLQVEHTTDTGIEACYRALSDFDAILQGGKQGGTGIRRLDAPLPISDTSCWDGQLDVHGLRKSVLIEVAALSPPHGFQLNGRTDGVEAVLKVSLEEISPAQTRMSAEVTLSATSFSGKLFLKPLQLVKSSLEERLAKRLIRLLTP